MEVSKLSISEDTIKKGEITRNVIEWLLKHPNRLNHTNWAILSKTMALDSNTNFKVPTASIKSCLVKLAQREIIIKRGGNRRFDVTINFNHHLFPPDLAEKYGDTFDHDGPAKDVVDDGLYNFPPKTVDECIVEYLNEHPLDGVHTTVKDLSKKISEDKGVKFQSVGAQISKLKAKGILSCEPTSQPFVNNWTVAKDDPNEELEEGDATEEETTEQTIADMNREIREEIVDSTPQLTSAGQAVIDRDRILREEIAESGAPGTEEPTAETVCPEPITVKTDGGEIKLSITLNINITR